MVVGRDCGNCGQEMDEDGYGNYWCHKCSGMGRYVPFDLGNEPKEREVFKLKVGEILLEISMTKDELIEAMKQLDKLDENGRVSPCLGKLRSEIWMAINKQEIVK